MRIAEKILLTAILAVMAVAGHTLYAMKITVLGIVVDDQGNPLNAVQIYDVATNEPVGYTNLDGKFDIYVEEYAVLRFESVILNSEIQVEVNGRRNLPVLMPKNDQVLNEVVVEEVYRETPVPKPKEQPLKYRNGYLIMETTIPIWNKFFDTGCRLTVQPVLTNVTKGVRQYMHPLIIEGWRYGITQDRMLDFDKEHADPCDPYVKNENKRYTKKGFDAIYLDSIKVISVTDEYGCQFISAVEDYNKLIALDTAIVANGVVNPLRFFQYSMLGRMVEDPKFLPSPERGEHTDNGNVDLSFEVNSTTLNVDYRRNRVVLDSLMGVFHKLENNSVNYIKGFSLTAKSSPEGVYKRNIALSQARMKAALDFIMSNLSESTKRSMRKEPETNAVVEKWQVLVDRLHSDGHHDEADKIQEIIDRYGKDHDACGARIRNLPFYRPMITDNYLPGMRSVTYTIQFVQIRSLTNDEILEKFAKDSTSLTEYEYFRLYRDILTDDAQKERVMRLGVKYKPKSRVIANDLAAFLINHKKADPSILERVFADVSPYEKLPNEMRYNQVAALLAVGRYGEAYEVAYRLPDDDPVCREAHLYAKIFNYEITDDVVAEIGEESLMNEVVLLLCQQKNEVALAKSRGLGDTAEEEYIKAICCLRVYKNTGNFDLEDEAQDHMYKALEKKPELKSILSIDGDLVDFYNQCERVKKANEEEYGVSYDSESSDTTTESGSETENTENTETSETTESAE